MKSKQIRHEHTHTNNNNVFLHKQNTHAVKSIKNHQLSSKQDLAAKPHWPGGEEVICGRSVSHFRAEEPEFREMLPFV